MPTHEQRHYTKFQVFWGVEFQAPPHPLYETLWSITCSYLIYRQELSQMNHDLEARLAQLQSENLQSSEQLSLLTQQLSTAQREAQLANRLLEETRAKLQDSQKQHQENVSLGFHPITCHFRRFP